MLSTGRFLNAIIVLTVALSAVSLAFYILKRWSRTDKELKFFGLFWFFTAILWVSVTCRSLAAALNNYELDHVFFKFAQLNVFVSAAFLGAYVFEKMFHVKALTNSMLAVCVVLAITGIFFTITLPIIPVDLENFFATEYDPSPEAQMVFLVIIVPIMLLLVTDIFHQWKNLAGFRKDLMAKAGTSLSVLVYLILGYFDQSGIIGWPVLLLRLLYIGAFSMAYMSIINVLKEDDLVYGIKETDTIGHL